MSEYHDHLRRRWGLISLLILAIVFPFAVIGEHLQNDIFIYQFLSEECKLSFENELELTGFLNK
jgi:hypothetical protein